MSNSEILSPTAHKELKMITDFGSHLGDNVQFVPGHGPDSTFGRERATNPFVADMQFG